MHSKNIFRMWTITAILVLIISACSPKPAPDVPADLPQDIPVEQPAENPFSPAGLGDCYNPFNPVIEGITWSYSSLSGDIEDSFSVFYRNVSPSSFTSVHESTDSTTEIDWTCSPDGLLSSEFANLNMTDLENVEFETMDVTGVLFPNEANWQVGYSWDVSYKMKIIVTIEENKVESEGEVATTNTISGIETVTVTSGTYNDAYRVDTESIITIRQYGVESEITLTYSSWYIKNVGLVKSGTDDASIPFLVELISME